MSTPAWPPPRGEYELLPEQVEQLRDHIETTDCEGPDICLWAALWRNHVLANAAQVQLRVLWTRRVLDRDLDTSPDF